MSHSMIRATNTARSLTPFLPLYLLLNLIESTNPQTPSFSPINHYPQWMIWLNILTMLTTKSYNPLHSYPFLPSAKKSPQVYSNVTIYTNFLKKSQVVMLVLFQNQPPNSAKPSTINSFSYPWPAHTFILSSVTIPGLHHSPQTLCHPSPTFTLQTIFATSSKKVNPCDALSLSFPISHYKFLEILIHISHYLQTYKT